MMVADRACKSSEKSVLKTPMVEHPICKSVMSILRERAWNEQGLPLNATVVLHTYYIMRGLREATASIEECSGASPWNVMRK